MSPPLHLNSLRAYKCRAQEWPARLNHQSVQFCFAQWPSSSPGGPMNTLKQKKHPQQGVITGGGISRDSKLLGEGI